MILNISIDNTNVIERGVYYFGLSDYPHITTTDLKNVIAFIKYEVSHGRQTQVVCQDEQILEAVNNALSDPESIEGIALPLVNDFIYHATDIESAIRILSGGKLLSAEKVYGKSGEELSIQKSSSLWNDPADYFEYIMFCWGDSPIGDYVVLSENFLSDDDLAKGNFTPGVRFYFRYEDIVRHPGHMFDGYHPVKVKDEIMLTDYLYACIVPEQYKSELEGFVPQSIMSKMFFLSNNGVGLDDWNKIVYDYVRML